MFSQSPLLHNQCHKRPFTVVSKLPRSPGAQFSVAASQEREPLPDKNRRSALAMTLLGGLCLGIDARRAIGDEAPTPIYFGNGCFWGRQKDFVDAEKSLGRKPDQISSVAGYAGGVGEGEGPVCYYYGKRDTVYEGLGHAEVVQLDLTSNAEKEMETFATTYFKQFQKTRQGMQRLDPQDAGPGYRNVIGLPGGVDSPLFKVLQKCNVNGMNLVAGEGNKPGHLVEGDKVNTVYILDSNLVGFHQAEQYHQFHNGIGVPFGPEYTKKQKQIAQRNKRIGPTGCPEIGGLFG